MSNADALKALYVAVGGELTDTHSSINGSVPVKDYTLIADVIAACAAKIASGSMKELPTVAAPGDNGKVLTVVNGAWAAAAATTQAVG